MRELLAGARHPARNVEQNVADLRAQIAANEKGREELLRMVRHFGLDTVRAYMAHVQDNACLLYTSPSPRDRTRHRMPSSD